MTGISQSLLFFDGCDHDLILYEIKFKLADPGSFEELDDLISTIKSVLFSFVTGNDYDPRFPCYAKEEMSSVGVSLVSGHCKSQVIYFENPLNAETKRIQEALRIMWSSLNSKENGVGRQFQTLALH